MKICDAHNDFLTDIKSKDEKNNYIKFIKNNKSLKTVACVVWTTELKYPIETLNNFYKNCFEKPSKKLILCLEDLGFINKNNFDFCIKQIINLKPFSCGIVWNNDNNLGGGAFGKLGLTDLGIMVVKELEKNNIIIDTAHMNEKTFWQFAKITTKPLYNSHCNLSFFKQHKRNLNTKQIEYIVHSNGFIGLSFVQTFVSNNLIDARIIAKQLAYFVRNFGYNNIGIGTDFYGTKHLPTNLKTYNDFVNLKKALKAERLSNKIINNILYRNLYRYKKSVLKN